MNLIKVNTVPTIFNKMDSIIDSFFNSSVYDQNTWAPSYDILNNKDGYTILMEVPGIEKDNIALEFQDQVLTILGERKSESDTNYSNNFQYGDFRKEFNLPEDVLEKDISAHLKNGVLEIRIPRKAEVKTKAKKITIK